MDFAKPVWSYLRVLFFSETFTVLSLVTGKRQLRQPVNGSFVVVAVTYTRVSCIKSSFVYETKLFLLTLVKNYVLVVKNALLLI